MLRSVSPCLTPPIAPNALPPTAPRIVASNISSNSGEDKLLQLSSTILLARTPNACCAPSVLPSTAPPLTVLLPIVANTLGGTLLRAAIFFITSFFKAGFALNCRTKAVGKILSNAAPTEPVIKATAGASSPVSWYTLENISGATCAKLPRNAAGTIVLSTACFLAASTAALSSASALPAWVLSNRFLRLALNFLASAASFFFAARPAIVLAPKAAAPTPVVVSPILGMNSPMVSATYVAPLPKLSTSL